ncbi:hypothetical protein NDU88_008659 [Pleurodeles waltl]|uniref:Uncharacterized protein n=1 Tax=Pleurodeles waltl TaxID=8319 RepID=A0AAV7PQ39_PLEWA|nr:hypothetical protein NDU88_008659 [Pleurodeles waltl]
MLHIFPFIRRVRRFGAPGGQPRPIPDRSVLGLGFHAGGPEMPAPPGIARSRARALPPPCLSLWSRNGRRPLCRRSNSRTRSPPPMAQGSSLGRRRAASRSRAPEH